MPQLQTWLRILQRKPRRWPPACSTGARRATRPDTAAAEHPRLLQDESQTDEELEAMLMQIRMIQAT